MHRTAIGDSPNDVNSTLMGVRLNNLLSGTAVQFRRIHYRCVLFVATYLLASPQLLAEPTLELGKSRDPHYVGEAAVLRFTIKGVEKEEEPKVEFESTPGLRTRLVGVSPQVSSFISNINGRVTQVRNVTYQVTYQLSAEEAGNYTVGPFKISQGGKELDGQAVAFEFLPVDEDPDMRVRQILPDRPFFPGERVEVGIEWWYEASQAQDAFPPRITSLLFDQFTFIDQPPTRGEQKLPIETAAGEVSLTAKVREATSDGKTFLVVSAKRTMVVDKSGTYELPPISATIRKVTEWRRERSFFGGSRKVAVADKPFRAIGEPQVLMVKPLPLEGRPQSFAGAIGQGFSMQVTANRTVVQSGDPIKLEVTLRGDGNLENASLPPLSADGGLDPNSFRLPSGDAVGEFDGEKKTFFVSVRPNQAGTNEIPALAYSWFDPRTASYQTTRSKPIALSVTQGEIVDKSRVFSSVVREEKKANVPQGTESMAPEDSTEFDRFFVGADLSVSEDYAVLNHSSNVGGLWVQAALYLFGALMVAVALWDRRRADVDPKLKQRNHRLMRQRKAIQAATSEPRQQAAETVAAALRSLNAELPDHPLRDDLEAVVANCESIIYQPGASSTDRLESKLVADAQRLADGYLGDHKEL